MKISQQWFTSLKHRDKSRLFRILLAVILLSTLCRLSYITQKTVDQSGQIHSTRYKTNEKETSSNPKSEISREVTSPNCGEACDTESNFTALPGLEYEFLQKHFNCQSLLQRMKLQQPAKKWPPPLEVPEQLRTNFSMFGKMPIRRALNSYFAVNNVKSTKDDFINDDIINALQDKARAGRNIAGGYGKSGMDQVIKAIETYNGHFKAKKGLVIGSEKPWVEALLLNANVKHITILEYSKLISHHQKISAVQPVELAQSYLSGEQEQFDFGISYSSIEHSGLGRYGDELNPFGDLEAMAQAWCLLKPGGLFLLNVPYDHGENYVLWNAHRVYGIERLKHLTANWKVLEILGNNKRLWILQKPDT